MKQSHIFGKFSYVLGILKLWLHTEGINVFEKLSNIIRIRVECENLQNIVLQSTIVLIKNNNKSLGTFVHGL